MVTSQTLVLMMLVSFSTADFTCLCNYNVELNVYSDTNNGSTKIGMLYEFDCKETYQTKQVKDWQAIQYEHKVGFVSTYNLTSIQTCPGDSPVSDKVPTATRSGTRATTTLVMTPTTLVSQTSTTAAQTTTATTSTAPNTSSTTLTVLTSTPTLHLRTTTTSASTSKSSKNLATTSSKTTVVTVQTANTTALPIISMPSPIATTKTTTITTLSSTPITTTITTTPATAFTTQTTSTATPTTIRPTITPKTSSIATPTTTPTISPPTTPMTTTATHIATSTTNNTTKPTLAQSTTTITTPTTSSTTTPTTSPTTNPSTMTTTTPTTTSTTTPTTSPPTNPSTMTTTTTTMTSPPTPSTTSTILHTSTSNKYRCPFGVLMRIPLEYIIQHGNYCYQLYPYQTKDWMTAESYCEFHNGSLAVISHSDIQTVLMLLLLKLNYRHPVWIGLHDMRTEGTWEWADGTLLSHSSYENWRPGHVDRVYHNEEDCAILDPNTGLWIEVVCKGFLLDQQRHPWICQYNGDVPCSTSYGVYISQPIRFARASSHVADFNTYT